MALGGQAISLVAGGQPGSSEGIGILAAIIIMLLAFGSVVAMGLPIITALFGIAIGFAVLDLLTHVLTTPTFAPEMMAMIGLGVGIDYALFIVTRYRQGLAEGRDPRQAAAVSLATSGRSVLFAGTTVILSLLGLFILQLPFMHGLAVGAIAAVVLVMAGRHHPAAGHARLRRAGHRPAARPRAPADRGRALAAAASGTGGAGPSSATRSSPELAALLVPGAAGHPASSPCAWPSPTPATTRPRSPPARPSTCWPTGFGPGFNGPLVVAASRARRAERAAVEHPAAARLAATPGVAFATPVQFNASGHDAVIIAYPTTVPPGGPDRSHSSTTCATPVIPAATAGTGVRCLRRAGRRPGSVDASAYLSSRLVWVIGAVLLLAFLLLMAVFRSVAIPVKAAVMNLLSVGAAYGVIVAVFQWGWLGSVIGIGATGPIDPWIPLMMFTILFGLSMDYEVFLLSRIREEWRRTGDNSDGGGRRPGQDGPGHHRGGRHHDLRVRLVRHR